MSANWDILGPYLDQIIADDKQAKLRREETIEKIKRNVCDALVGKPITKVNFDDNGYILNIEVNGMLIKPTGDYADDEECGEFYWLRVVTDPEEGEGK